MSTPEKQTLAILGGGCAGLSLAARLASHEDLNISIIDPADGRDRPDHSWGFWKIDATRDAFAMARQSWSRWQIITPRGHAIQTARHHPYASIESKAWLTDARRKAENGKTATIKEKVHDIAVEQNGYTLMTDRGNIRSDLLADSRSPHYAPGVMLQHFIGWEIETDHDCFDPETATLMDFRCDASRGVHFIYVLPFGPRRALVESTMFSPRTEPDEFYETAIDQYCRSVLACDRYIILRRERGVIPMAQLAPHDSRLTAIGGNGGAIRPSSGYAFAFIQKQVAQIAASLENRAMPKGAVNPHQPLDLWMDGLFLTVLRAAPETAPRLFLAMAKALSGDEMARFLSGEADHRLRFKVIMAMPKWPFLKALMRGKKG